MLNRQKELQDRIDVLAQKIEQVHADMRPLFAQLAEAHKLKNEQLGVKYRRMLASRRYQPVAQRIRAAHEKIAAKWQAEYAKQYANLCGQHLSKAQPFADEKRRLEVELGEITKNGARKARLLVQIGEMTAQHAQEAQQTKKAIQGEIIMAKDAQKLGFGAGERKQDLEAKIQARIAESNARIGQRIVNAAQQRRTGDVPAFLPGA